MLYFSGVVSLLASSTAFPFSRGKSVGYCILFLRGDEPVSISRFPLSSSRCTNIDEWYRQTSPHLTVSLLLLSRRFLVNKRNSETRPCFSSDPCEFVRVGNDANRLNTPFLHLNGQDGEYLTASANDQGCLTVDFLSLEGLELLQQHQERHRDRLFPLDALCWIF